MIADTRPGGAGGGDTGAEFAHRVLFYTDAEEFLAATVPFLQDGLARGDTLLVVTVEANIRLLRDALGDDADRIDFADAAGWYRYPAQTLAAYCEYVDHHPGRHIRIIGEPFWHGRTEAEIRAWTRYESMCNELFAGSSVVAICPYDVRRVSPGILANALRTHPEQVIDTVCFRNRIYVEPAELAAELCQETAELPAAPATIVRSGVVGSGVVGSGSHHPVKLRHLIADAVDQVEGRGTLRMWYTGERLVCEVTSPVASSGGPFGYLRRLALRWSRASGRGWRPAAHRRGSDGGPCRDDVAAWDWPG